MSGKTKCPLFVMAQMVNGKQNKDEDTTICLGPICEWYVRNAPTSDATTTEGCSVRLIATQNSEGDQTA
ncbi:hypothetical protein KA005_31785 [bacterium]|nr:hypothetical protein [bacterium]